jgi:hypothetical protein
MNAESSSHQQRTVAVSGTGYPVFFTSKQSSFYVYPHDSAQSLNDNSDLMHSRIRIGDRISGKKREVSRYGILMLNTSKNR